MAAKAEAAKAKETAAQAEDEAAKAREAAAQAEQRTGLPAGNASEVAAGGEGEQAALTAKLATTEEQLEKFRKAARHWKTKHDELKAQTA